MTKILKALLFLTLSLAVGFLNAYTPLENIRVIDGDTIRAEAKGKEIKIRLVEIDAVSYTHLTLPTTCSV